ncbi:hypothetical protein PHLGIDRAFT_497204 [Phlebiopsis gigantea 11061_1 CR5-6]|uniref:Pseudouridine synthase I TruA alpha/beta domain-containing protein n=1 Tax=Phlebiopsis gigantea (strain 11061_1 CR5-6) TaxID=745531 RepID=A0A0C3NFE7_PHLG1|nr:hypothetical protein PHLGIDRAFT_497204 [Phlebiopsis gigantea 11061_1 CR5-6]
MESPEQPVTANPELKRARLDEGPAEASLEKKPRVQADVTPSDSGVSAESSTQARGKGKGKKEQSRRAGRAVRQQNREQGQRGGTRAEGEEVEEDSEKGPRLPKRQCALLLGFCGSAYNGMQIQTEVRTIEGVLFEALGKAGAVSKDNSKDLKKVNFNRAARTDAGVHAAGNLVSMKMIMEVPDVPDLTARVNELLPPDVRLWGFVRVQNSFNARSRKYTYFFPSYMLIPPKTDSALYKSSIEQHGASFSLLDFWKDASVESTPADDLIRKRQWRAPKEAVEALREIAKRYEGSHKFHNFTVGHEFNEMQSLRYMKKIEISDPVVYGETEWISVVLHGQSFMLHQVRYPASLRKMMAALILACRTNTPATVIEELCGPRGAFVPKMPALGLMLEYPIFETYNKRIQNESNKSTDDKDYRAPIDFELHREKIEQFKEEFIYPKMRDVEDRSGIFDAWLRSIDKYEGSDLLWLGPKGILPDAAVIQRGKHRTQPFREKKRFDATSFPEGRIEEMDAEDEEEIEVEEDISTDKNQPEGMEA